MSVLTVAYHSITPTWHNDLAVRPERFALQLQKLADRGYEGVTFRDAALGDQDRNVVAITFDDAFATVAEFAAPILRERGWPATVFPVTKPSPRASRCPGLLQTATARRARSWCRSTGSSSRNCPSSAGEIGSHSRTHRLLSRLSAAELARRDPQARGRTSLRTWDAARASPIPGAFFLSERSTRCSRAATRPPRA